MVVNSLHFRGGSWVSNLIFWGGGVREEEEGREGRGERGEGRGERGEGRGERGEGRRGERKRGKKRNEHGEENERTQYLNHFDNSSHIYFLNCFWQPGGRGEGGGEMGRGEGGEKKGVVLFYCVFC